MSDPITPPVLIRDPDRGYRHWLISEIYIPGGDGRYVPNVNDSVLDWTQGLLQVIAVDITTGISTLKKWDAPRDPSEMTDDDILLGAGPGYQSESYRMYLNTNVMPHALACDSRLHLYGTTASYIKVFLGTDISQAGEVISAFYDQSGQFLGENIPLETVVMPGVDNRAVKAPKVGYTLRQLNDGEVVTVVVYDDAAHAISIAKMLIKNTAFVRTPDASTKYITSIHVESPFISSSNPKLIEYPINMPVQSLNLMGVVTYSDGSRLRMPVDGTKFSMHGLENYIATVQGQKLPLVLSYKLSPNEYSYVVEPSPNKHISEAYEATTLRADGAYTVKLFAYPVWINALSGYRLEYYLYNLDRDQVYPVTNLVQMASDSRAFNPIEYGTVQKITVAIDLNRVDNRFANYRHVQTFEITLLAEGTNANEDNWTVGFSPGQNPPYGPGLQALANFINVNNWQLDIRCQCATKEEWLTRVYYATQPLYDPESEARAPEPNFFVLVAGNHRVEVPIDAWDSLITTHEAPIDGAPVYLEFLRRGVTTDLQLGVSALITHYPSGA